MSKFRLQRCTLSYWRTKFRQLFDNSSLASMLYLRGDDWLFDSEQYWVML